MTRILSILILLSGLAHGSPYWLPIVNDVPAPVERHAMPDNVWTGTTAWATGSWKDSELFDFSPARSNLTVVSPCATFGVGDYLTVTGITTANVVTCSGDASPTPSADRIDFTEGTAWDIKIDGTLVYPAQEDSGTIF
ncbi:MAG TPA: hypothetical protein VJ904_14750, partial [Tichowtungia sp.]|nr:hypothetical protein [Tichowtungia sp.]